ncbi:MAG: 50S ribosomal protein L6 [Cyclobacteriaceae bacterium]
MSRIGKSPISIPGGVTITVSDKNLVTVKGPKGELARSIDPDMKIEVSDSTVEVVRPTESKRHKSMHGLSRTLISNMIVGVNEGYKKELELIGVGYRANVQNNVLELNLGYSHNIFIGLPPELKVNAVAEKGKNPEVSIEGIDKELVGMVAAKIKSLRKVEPYKGKGVRYKGEYVRRKAGKTAAK